MSLEDFSARFVEYWRDKLSTEAFVSRFTAPNLTWMRAFEKMKTDGVFGSGQDAKNLLNNIEYRIKYEIMLEYGMLSRTGRTLEKSGCSVLSFNKDEIETVVATVFTRAVNELGTMPKYSKELFGQIVVGILGIMRNYGAFNDKVYNAFTLNDGKRYMLSNEKEKWMPGSHAGFNTPRFVYAPSDKLRKPIQTFDTIEKKYAAWVHKCFDDVMYDTRFEDIAKIIFDELLKANIVLAIPSPAEYKAWGLNKHKIFVSHNVKQFVCGDCGHSVSVSEENSDFWAFAPCVRAKCSGILHEDSNAELGYYGKLYNSGDVVRIVANEHTGLLEHDDRENLEQVFGRSGSDSKPWDTNVLSCTPTLEMGINIGDLSSVIMCNIPPSQAQYLQRTGRAGRKDGNAITISVASARPHDLYFYADPLDMIQGDVEPPKIFLKASAVLERQFLAYCMDCWIKKGVPETAIPKNIGVCMNSLETKNSEIFPFNFLKYVQSNISGLLRTFLQMFPELDGGEKADLEKFAKGSGLEIDSMYYRVYQAFAEQKKQKDSLQASIKLLNKMIKELKGKPQDSSYDDEIKELTVEKNSLANVVKSITKKDVFNFLSDEGLLPNYAFPESGIVLKAVLFRKNDSTDDGEAPVRKYEKMVYEYNRSTASAISEFAPLNHFYVDGRKLTVNQIDLTSAQVEKWRLCPNCPHAQLIEAGKDVAACPRGQTPAKFAPC